MTAPADAAAADRSPPASSPAPEPSPAATRSFLDGPRWFTAAVATGAVLRLLWVIWATRTPAVPADPAEYLRIASEFGHGTMPRFGGVGGPSDYWPPGYPLLLTPFVAFADRTGWISPAFMAALVNVVAGTVTIWLTGMLATQWISARARNVAAWLIALCPALIFFTATAHTETAFTAIFLLVILLSARIAPDARARTWVLLGVLVGAAFLVRTPAVITVIVPALSLRASRGSWRGALRATALVVAGSLVLLVPWTIRNGVQVGIWSPASTNNASAVCFGHHDGTKANWEDALQDVDIQQDCFGDSPYDDVRLTPVYEASGGLPPGMHLGHPHEVRWYREKMSNGIHWAIHHPVTEVRLSAQKTWVIWGDEGRVVDAARNYSQTEWAGRWHSPLEAAANLWLWIVGSLAIVGLALVPACRRALPLWVPIVLLTLAIVGGVAEPHYRYPAVPLVAILAAGLLVGRRPKESQ